MHGEARLARHRGIRIAVERVLADVEVEGREVAGHEGGERGEDALVVELGVGLAHQLVELGEPVQHQPLELRHRLALDAILVLEMRERAEHPAHGVAQLAIGLDVGLQDLRADAQVVGIVRGAHPQAQDVGAGLLDDVLRRDLTLPSDFDILRPSSSSTKPWVSTTSNGARPRVPQLSKQRRMEPAAMLVRAFEIHHRVAAAVDLALDAGERGEMLGVLQHEGVRRAGVEPDVENVVDLLPGVVGELAEEALARAGRVPGVGAFGLEGLDDAHVRPRDPRGSRPSRPPSP